MANMIRAMSSLLQRSGIANILGKQFGGKRDLYSVYGYSTNLSFQDHLAKYSRQDIAGRILEMPSNSIWSNPPTILSTSDAWNKAWKELVAKHSLFFVLNRLDNLAGLGRYAVLLMGFDKQGANFEAPLSRVDGRKVIYLQPYSEPASQILKLVDNKNDPDYQKPELYDLKPFLNQPLVPGQANISQASLRVHSSRVLHIVEGSLEDTIIGRPRMERVSNILDDMIKVSGGTSENFWLTANRGMQADIDKELELTAEDEKALTDELDEYQHQLRRWIRTRGVNIKSLGSDNPDPSGSFAVLLALLAGASGIPQRVLTGAEAGQLASEQDRANWAERVEERRRLFAEPIVLWPLIRKLTAAGVLPEEEGMEINIDWPSAFRMSPLEEAQTRAQQARSAVNLSRTLTDQETNGEEFISVDEARHFVGLEGSAPKSSGSKKVKARIPKAKDPANETVDEGTTKTTKEVADKSKPTTPNKKTKASEK